MIRRSLALVRAAVLPLGLFLSLTTSADLTVTPITWDVVGLNHNRPLTLGPDLFPVGARVCNETGAVLTNIDANFIWPDGQGNNWNDGQPGSGDGYINLRENSLTTLSIPLLDDDSCIDAYFEIQVTRATDAFGKIRPYAIEVVDSDENLLGATPGFRQIYIEALIRQNRNEIVGLRIGQDPDGSDWQDIAGGGTVGLVVGETYFVEKTTQTATGYQQLQSFIALSNTLFRIHAVETEYEELTFGAENRIPDPHSQLWADACIWQSDTQSPNYLSCTDTGKAGGEVRTVYEIEILSGGGSTVTLSTLIYDLSGGSFHYNADFDNPIELRNAVIIDPAQAGFSKRFIPATIAQGGNSTLRFTITNPNPAPVSGYNFIDNLPPGVEVSGTPNASTSCGGTWNPVAMDTTLTFSGGAIGANGTCTVVVDVTAATEGTYENTSENLFIDDIDSGTNAQATLEVTDGPLPPACVPGTVLAEWTMDPSQGTAVPPAPFFQSPDAEFADARFEPSALPGVQTINTGNGNPPNSWQGTGWGLATNPVDAGPGPEDVSYFEFELDTSSFNSDPTEPLAISIDVNPAPTGNWATPANITVNVHASIDGGPFATIMNVNPIPRDEWTTLTGSVTPGVDDVRLRVNVSGRSGGNPNATFLIDNIVFSGCGPADPADLLEPPTLSKNFSPDPIGVGEVSTLTFTLTNPNGLSGEELTGVSFTDELPPGMEVANPPNASTTCDGTPVWSPAPMDAVLEFSDGQIAAGESCIAQVDVTSSAVGTSLNISNFVYANESGQNTTSSGFAIDELSILAPPMIAKQFVPELVLLGITPDDASTLTLIINNPNSNHAISGVVFEDNLPGDLVVAAVPNAATSGCGSPTWNPAPNDGLLQFSGGTIGPGGVCTVTVDVTGPAGDYNNETDTVSHLVGGVEAQGNTAQASLVIDNPIPGIRIRKEISPGGPAPDPGESEADIWPWSGYLAIPENDDVYYLLVIENIGEIELTNVVISDSILPLDPIADCTWPDAVGSLDVADVDGSHIAMCLLGPVTANEGETTNFVEAASDQVTDCDAPDFADRPARCSATYATTGLAIEKTADPTTYEQVGDIIEYSFLVTNTGFAILNGAVIVDDDLTSDESCPDLISIGNLDNFFDPGEAMICTATYEITAADVTNGSVTNIAFAFTPEAVSGIDDATVTLTGANPELTVAKALTDAPTPIELGSVLEYTITATNTGDVTLTDVVVSDPMLTPDQNSCASVAVNDTCVLVGTYTVTQSDIDAGQISNTGTGTSNESDPDDDTVITPIDQSPELSVAKALTDEPTPIELGSVLEYTITATNTGNVTLTDVVVSDPMLSPASETCPSVAVNDTCVLVGTYTVTQSDIDAGQISNTGTGTSNESDPDDDTVITPIDQNPELSVAKALTDAPTPIELGSVLEYTITATNTGNVTLTDVVVSDPMLSPAIETCPSVAVNDTCVLVGTYTVTQSDIDAGQISNTGTGTSNESDPDDDTVITPIDQVPALELVKLADLDDANGNGFADAGEVIDYTLTATNSGNVTLADVVMVDGLLDATPGGLDCTPVQPASLEPGEALVCTGSYTVTQADVDAGDDIVNEAAASAPHPVDPSEPDLLAEDSTTTPIVPSAAAIELLKLITAGDPYANVGDLIDYQLTATNSGNVTLFDVEISDPLLGTLVCVPVQPAELAPGESLVCEGSYTVGQAEIDAGSFTNDAAVNAEDPDENPVTDEDSATATGPAANPGLSVVKALTNAPTPIELGSVLEYTITATNTGNVTLTNVVVTDPMLTPDQNSCASVAVNDTCVLVGTYTVTQSDIDAGQISNTGTGNSNESDPDDDTVITPIDQNPELTVAKALTDAPTPIELGSVLEYTITATNTGDVTLTNVVVTDPMLTPNQNSCASVAVNDTCVLVGTYTVTQSDIDAGQISNTGTADSDESDPEEDTVVTPIGQDPALSIAKELTDAPDPIVEGSVLTYTVTATNAGNVTLTNVVVSDTLIDPSSTTCATLAVGADCVLTGTYTVTQADIDAGQISNTGTGNSDESDPEEDTIVTPIDQLPGLELLKEAVLDDINGNGFADTGEVIDYTLTATNSGNITLNDVVILDDLLDDTPGGLDCVPALPAALEPGESVVCTGSYTVTQADVDAGDDIVNEALASAPDPTDPGEELTAEDSTTTPIAPADAVIELDKQITAGDPYANVGDVIDYQITAENTGNVTLFDVTISDPAATVGVCLPAQPAELAPGESLVCEASYTITQADIDAGSFTNIATVSATDPNTDPVEDSDDATASAAGAPALSVAKALTDAPSPIEVGSVLEYTVTATNTGNVTLTNVVVSDPLIDPSSTTCPTLAVGADCVLVGTYTVTQADIDAGEISNTGTADSDETDPEQDTVITPIGQNPALSVVKELSGAPHSIVEGSVLGYTVTATNTGNVTLTNVLVSDPILDPSSASCPSMAPEDTCVLVGTYTVTQADVDAGEIQNTGTADSDETDMEEDTVTTPIGQGPALSIAKELTDAPDPIVEGSVLTYTVTATNIGNVTLTDMVVTDSLTDPSSATCPSVPLNDTCVLVGSYTVTADNMLAGELTNIAVATALDPDGVALDPVEDSVTVVLADIVPPLEPEPIPVPAMSRGFVITLAMMLFLLGLLGTARTKPRV